VGLAILFGVCTPLALVFPFLFFAAIVKFLAVKLKTYLNSKFGNKARIVFMAFLGGLIFGVIGYILPLTPGDGNYQMDAVVQHGSQIASSVLIISAYGKMFTYWVSTEFGFVGGIFHPILTISVMFFRMAINETRIADILGTALSFVLLAAAFTPLPFSMFLMDLALFNLKASEQVSLFVAIVISHLMSAGVGFPQKFLSLGLKKVD
jgi:H+/Cl- antiporter ClcA